MNRIRAFTVAVASSALVLTGSAVAVADDGDIGIGAAGGGSVSTSAPAAGRVLSSHLTVGYKYAAGRSLYTIERQRGYSPEQARYLANRIIQRIYPGAWWADGTRTWARGYYVPLWDMVFYYR